MSNPATSSDKHGVGDAQEWRDAGEPLPTSAIEVNTGSCAYDCGREADYLVKVENMDGNTAKFRVCQTCNDENRIWAERHLPPEAERQTAQEGES